MTTITPIPGALEEFNAKHPGHIEKLCEALQTSNQHIGRMCNDDDTAHCCLCVSARVEGRTFEEYGGAVNPSDMVSASMTGPSIDLEDLCFSEHRSLVKLNDGDDLPRALTHPEIAELLRGNAVTVGADDE